MKLLVISTSYPPFWGSHTQRIVGLIDALEAYGFDICLLTSYIEDNHPSYDEKSIEFINEKIKIIRVPLGILHRYSSNKNEEREYIATKGMLKERMKASLRSVLVPDSMVDWLPRVARIVKSSDLISRVRPDVILSCSMPNTCHIVGYGLSKKYGIPLILDYADPWAYEPGANHNRLKYILQKRLESRILDHSAGSTYSCESARLLNQTKFNLDRSKTITIYTGFSAKKSTSSDSHKISSNNQELVITYGGDLDPKVRDPIPLFISLQRVSSLSIQCIIRTNLTKFSNYYRDYPHSDCLVIADTIPFDEYYKEMCRSDMLIIFGNNNNIQLPGKLFNCIATGRRILYIRCSGHGCEAEEILRDYGNADFVDNDPDQIEAMLRSLLIEKRIGELDRKRIGNISRYSSNAQGQKLAQFIKDIVDNKKSETKRIDSV